MFSVWSRQERRRLVQPQVRHGGRRKKKKGLISAVFVIQLLISVLLVVLVGLLFHTFSMVNEMDMELSVPNSKDRFRSSSSNSSSSSRRIQRKYVHQSEGGFEKWKKRAVELAKLPAEKALEELKATDPFGVRAFHDSLVEKETELGRTLHHEELLSLFPCPAPKDRVTLPDFRDQAKAQAFRSNSTTKNTFLFFQHLRKAGGTHFCSLAQANLPANAVAKYFCMPDMAWSGNKNAGYLKNWSNQEIITRMANKGHRILGNEFQNFDPKRHFDLPAVFATSFRKPIDRALSQFRFECIEDRGCHIKDPQSWWALRKDLYNVYTRTFSDQPLPGLVNHYQNNHPPDILFRQNIMATAIDTISKFNLVLSMEWLSYASFQVTQILGFQNTQVLNKRVRPHIQNHQRNDGQELNHGAAGIAKASWVPEDHLSKQLLQRMGQDLVLDEILTDVARRIFLERLVCS